MRRPRPEVQPEGAGRRHGPVPRCIAAPSVQQSRLALDIADLESLKQDEFLIGEKTYKMWNWASQFWQKEMEPGIYKAAVATTFALDNKAFFDPAEPRQALLFAKEIGSSVVPVRVIPSIVPPVVPPFFPTLFLALADLVSDDYAKGSSAQGSLRATDRRSASSATENRTGPGG
jgi:hypothetical protein